MTDPFRISFEVGCDVDHAFATWTERTGTWWPADHTVSGAPTAVVLEGRVGGRIDERTAQGRSTTGAWSRSGDPQPCWRTAGISASGSNRVPMSRCGRHGNSHPR